jgi:NAD(P)-dependent dehydrogenase (short-subunit alcohol dehydrogenase family)
VSTPPWSKRTFTIRLDILVNSAGVFVTGLVGDPATDMAALQRQFAINVVAWRRPYARRRST